MTSAANITEQDIPAFPYAVFTWRGAAFHSPTIPKGQTAFVVLDLATEARLASGQHQILGPRCQAMVQDIHSLRGRAL